MTVFRKIRGPIRVPSVWGNVVLKLILAFAVISWLILATCNLTLEEGNNGGWSTGGSGALPEETPRTIKGVKKQVGLEGRENYIRYGVHHRDRRIRQYEPGKANPYNNNNNNNNNGNNIIINNNNNIKHNNNGGGLQPKTNSEHKEKEDRSRGAGVKVKPRIGAGGKGNDEEGKSKEKDKYVKVEVGRGDGGVRGDVPPLNIARDGKEEERGQRDGRNEAAGAETEQGHGQRVDRGDEAATGAPAAKGAQGGAPTGAPTGAQTCPGTVYRVVADPQAWQMISNSSYIYSAYLDHRQFQSAVRAVGVVVPSRTPKWCHLFYPGQKDPQRLRVHTKVIPEGHGYQFSTTEYICYLTSKRQRPCGMTLTMEEEDPLVGFVPIVSSFNTRHPKTNFTACIPPLYGSFSNVERLVENIELKRTFGADFFIIYIYSVDTDVINYLKYYASIGKVRVVPWLLPTHNVHYYGQLAALTDCMLQSMYTSKYVVFSDLDEVIVPANHSNWSGMIEAIGPSQGAASMCFQNTFISLQCANDGLSKLNANAAKISEEQEIVGLIKRRRSEPNKLDHYSKCIVDPQGVETVGIHFMHTVRQRYWKAYVLPSIGLVYHYRERYPCSFTKLRDDRLLYFADQLVKQIPEVHNRVKAKYKCATCK